MVNNHTLKGQADFHPDFMSPYPSDIVLFIASKRQKSKVCCSWAVNKVFSAH